MDDDYFFEGGYAELYLYKFKQYESSVGKYIRDQSLKRRRSMKSVKLKELKIGDIFSYDHDGKLSGVVVRNSPDSDHVVVEFDGTPTSEREDMTVFVET